MNYPFITLVCLLTPANPFSSQAVSSLERFTPLPSLPTPPSLCRPLSIAYRSLSKGLFNRSMGTTPMVIPLRKTSLPLQTSINCISRLREGWGLMNPSLLCTNLVQLRADMQKPCHIQKDRSHDDVPLLQVLHASAPLTEEAMFPEPWTE